MNNIKIPPHDDYGKWLYKNEAHSLFIMGNHKFALYSWMLARKKYNLDNATLLHFDYHYDCAIDSMVDDFIKKPSIKKALEQACFKCCPSLSPNRIMHDNFIIAAIEAGLFKDGKFVCKEDDVPSVFNSTKKVKGRKIDLRHYSSIDSCLRDINSIPQNIICLDIDLDYFNNSEVYGVANLDDENIIRNQLQLLKDIKGVVTTTIAVSEDFCGNLESSKKLLGYVKDIWKINDNIEDSLDISCYANNRRHQ